jgi:hypothetical protein
MMWNFNIAQVASREMQIVCLDDPVQMVVRTRREAREEESRMMSIEIDNENDWLVEQLKVDDLLNVIQWKKDYVKPPWEAVSGGFPVLKRLWQEYAVLTLHNGVLKRTFYKPIGEILQVIVPCQSRANIV